MPLTMARYRNRDALVGRYARVISYHGPKRLAGSWLLVVKIRRDLSRRPVAELSSGVLAYVSELELREKAA